MLCCLGVFLVHVFSFVNYYIIYFFRNGDDSNAFASYGALTYFLLACMCATIIYVGHANRFLVSNVARFLKDLYIQINAVQPKIIFWNFSIFKYNYAVLFFQCLSRNFFQIMRVLGRGGGNYKYRRLGLNQFDGDRGALIGESIA